MKSEQKWLWLACLVVGLFFSVSNAKGATAFLEWNFDSEPLGTVGDWQVIDDAVGSRYGYARLNTGTLNAVASPVSADTSNHALQFGTFGGNARVYQQFAVTAYPANQTQVAPGVFSSGASARTLVKIDTPVSSSDTAEYLTNLYDANGNPVFGLTYTFGAYGGASDEAGFTAKIKTSTGMETLMVSQSAIEAQLGYGIVGKAIVPLITWSPVDNQLNLFVDGQLVGSEATTGAMTLSTTQLMVFLGNDLWLNTNRLSTYDDFKIWSGSFSSAEALADYQTIVPEPMSLILLVIGGFLLRRRVA